MMDPQTVGCFVFGGLAVVIVAGLVIWVLYDRWKKEQEGGRQW